MNEQLERPLAAPRGDEEVCVLVPEGMYSERNLIEFICSLRRAEIELRKTKAHYLPMPGMPQ